MRNLKRPFKNHGEGFINMGNKLLDYEDNMKVLVNRQVLSRRKELCSECQYKGANGFCQKNAQWLEEFVKYRYNECPAGIWVDGWRQD